jgi:hypothetical protein
MLPKHDRAMRWAHRSIAAALVAPLLVLAVTAAGFVGLRCRMTGVVSLDTCCPEPDRGETPAQSSIGVPGCCERIVVANAKPAATPVALATDGLLQVYRLALLPVVAALAPPVGPAPAVDLEPPLIPKLPLRLLKRSLLI